MKYYLISEKDLNDNYRSTMASILKDMGVVIEATPENLAKLNLIPKKERKPFAVGDKIKFVGPISLVPAFFAHEPVLAEIIEVNSTSIKIKTYWNGGQKYIEGSISTSQVKSRLIPKPKPKAVRVTRELLAKFWNSASAEYADSSEKFKDMCKELGID